MNHIFSLNKYRNNKGIIIVTTTLFKVDKKNNIHKLYIYKNWLKIYSYSCITYKNT